MIKKSWVRVVLLLSVLALAVYVRYLGAAVLMVVQTNPKPVWGPARTWKTGATNGLDGKASTGNTGFRWSCTAYDPGSGSTTCPLMFSSTSASQPTVTAVTTGDYTIQLCDGAGMNCVTKHIGAIDYDATTCIAKTHNSVADSAYGPMLAIGCNPWGFEDERHTAAIPLQYGLFTTPNPYNPYTDLDQSWLHDLTGTVSWTWDGTGNTFGGGGTVTNTGAVNPTDLTIHISNASTIDLSQFPTRIMLTSDSLHFEEVRICSASSTSGASDLTVCFDGRGVANPSNSYVLGPSTWMVGTKVGQQLVKGTGTSMLATFAPAGAGGQIGPVVYNTSTVSISGPTITGSGTTWDSSTCGLTAKANNAVCVGYAIVISVAHSRTAQKAVCYITAVSVRSITCSRSLPSFDSNSGLSYSIVIPWYRFLVTHFTRQTPYSGDGMVSWAGTGCESNTECFFSIAVPTSAAHDSGSLNGRSWSGGNITYQDNTPGPTNIGFYSPAMAFRIYWYRSGIVRALQMANALDDSFVRSPNFGGQGEGSGPFTLYHGAAIMEAWISYAIRGSPSYVHMEPFANNTIATSACDSNDGRDKSYAAGETYFAALYDPGAMQSTFRTLAQRINTQENACRRTNGGVDTNSWANGFYSNAGGLAIAFTNGKAVGTGTSIPSSACSGLEQPTVSVTANSASIKATMGTFSSSANAIIINGHYFAMTRRGSTTATLGVLWPGSTTSSVAMTIAYTDSPQNYLTSYGQSPSDTALQQNYGCIRDVSGTFITLDRNWSSASGTYHQYTLNVSGYAQQPFYMGIKTYTYSMISALDATLGTNFATLLGYSSTWLATYGFDSDPASRAIYYARVCSFCESGGKLTPGSSLDWATPGTRTGLSINVSLQRELNQEGFQGLIYWYLANPTPTNKAIVDGYYGALWGSDRWDDSSVHAYTDAASLGNIPQYYNLSNASLSAGKYTGQYFGMGQAHLWPAIRARTLGGSVMSGK